MASLKPEEIDQMELEVRALALVLANSAAPAYKGLSKIGADIFVNQDAKDIMLAMRDIAEEGLDITYSELLQRVGHSNGSLSSVMAYSKTDHAAIGLADRYVDLLKKSSAVASCRTSIAACFDLLNRGENPSAVHGELLEALEKGVENDEVPFSYSFDVARQLEQGLSDVWSGRVEKLPYLPTELGDGINDPLSGGWFYDNVNIVGARPSVGKTALWELEVLRKGERGIGSIVVSLEMPASQHMLRMANKITPTPIRIKDLYIRGFLQQAEFLMAVNRIAALPIAFVAQEKEVVQLLAGARKAVANWPFESPPQMLVLDYIQLLRDSRSFASRQVEVARCSSAVMDFSRRHGMACIQLAQLNRKQDSEDREPALSDLRESGDLEQDATNVLLLHRKLINDNNPGGDQEASVIIAKARHGTPTKVPMLWNGGKTEWIPIAKPMWGDGAF